MGVRVSASRLAGAVARAGGIGTIASVALGLSSKYFTGKQSYFEANRLALADEIAAARKAAPDGIIAVNNMVALTDYETMVRTSAEHGANVIISGAGLPMQLPEFTSGFPDVALVPIVSSMKAASLIVRKWEKAYHRLPDAFIVEAPGTAGGHLGAKLEEVDSAAMSLDAVVPALVKYVSEELKADMPVIAAGGVWNREDVLHSFSLGAKGVQMGTRFVCTYECDAADEFKKMYMDATEKDVVLIKSPVGLPGRAIKNPFTEQILLGPYPGHKCIANCLKHCSFKKDKIGFCIATALTKAHTGDVDHGLVFCGSNVGRCTGLVHVQDIMDELFPAV
jgi:nitronate monooxygenase